MEKLVLIERPLAEVYDYVADWRNSQGYLGPNFHFEAVSPPPFAVGTKAVALGSFMNIKIRLDYTMTAMTPNKLIRLEASNQVLNGIPVNSHAVWRFKAKNAGASYLGFELAIEPRKENISRMGMLMATPLLQAAELAVSVMLDRAMKKLKVTLERTKVAGVA